ncbi:MAG: DUF4271 domain-containing protein [Candidatus Amulumruptor sp.]|nr:DUF4271 domain-containing protein [Candidatus Amulumruptor sp.]
MRILALNDSTGAARHFVPAVCHEEEAPHAGAEGAGAHTGVVEYVLGIEPAGRPKLPGYDDGVSAMLIGSFVLLAVSVSRHTTYLKTFASALLSGRRRNNTFDDHTVDESRITGALLVMCCICEGILLYFATGAPLAPFTGIAAGTAVAVAMMCFQTAACFVTGYAFSTHAGDTSQWLRGLFASQALLGLFLTLPALMLLFYPGAAAVAVRAGIGLYIMARLMFICKGFRFFYTNIFSLVYFILYLCTLEIAPLAFLWRISVEMSSKL